ncbi:hypothetical protein ACET3Z_032232 [Daucus carota]
MGRYQCFFGWNWAGICQGEYCNGAVYLIRVNRLSCYCFDIDAEKLTQIALPPQARGSHFRHFGESCGHLYLAGVRDNTAKILNVYELNLVNMKWNIKHWVHIDRLISSFPQVNVNGGNQMCHSTQSILGFLRGERDEDSALIANVLGTVVSYNFKSKKVEVLLSELQWKDDSRSISAGPPFVPAYPLIASLHPFRVDLLGLFVSKDSSLNGNRGYKLKSGALNYVSKE